jgi:uncharacterized membrane protein
VKELLIIGFADKHRALEVLPQLQRLDLDRSADLHHAVAVEVEKDGRLRLFQGLLLDAATDTEDAGRWKALLSAILPLPHPSFSVSSERMAEVQAISVQAGRWVDHLSLDQDFIRNAAALLRPDSSALMAIVRDGEDAQVVMSGYSHFVLHTKIE